MADSRDNLYIGSFVDLFNFAGMVACRSGEEEGQKTITYLHPEYLVLRISLLAIVSLVDRRERGKVFALVAVGQTLSNVVAHLYSLIYTEAKDWHQGLVRGQNYNCLICKLTHCSF